MNDLFHIVRFAQSNSFFRLILWLGAEREEIEDERGEMGKWENGEMGE